MTKLIFKMMIMLGLMVAATSSKAHSAFEVTSNLSAQSTHNTFKKSMHKLLDNCLDVDATATLFDAIASDNLIRPEIAFHASDGNNNEYTFESMPRLTDDIEYVREQLASKYWLDVNKVEFRAFGNILYVHNLSATEKKQFASAIKIMRAEAKLAITTKDWYDACVKHLTAKDKAKLAKAIDKVIK